DDGDLADALVDAKTDLAAGGVVWLLTPKVGREGHVDESDIADAALTAGLSTTTTVSVTDEWSGTKLVAPKGSSRRRSVSGRRLPTSSCPTGTVPRRACRRCAGGPLSAV